MEKCEKWFKMFHHATMMKFHDCVSYDVDRFLEPMTERASVSDDKDR